MLEIKNARNTEHFIAKKNNKLAAYRNKWDMILRQFETYRGLLNNVVLCVCVLSAFYLTMQKMNLPQTAPQ